MRADPVYETCRVCGQPIQLITIPSVFKDNICPKCAVRETNSGCGCSVLYVLLFVLSYLTFDQNPLYPWFWLWIPVIGVYLVLSKISGELPCGLIMACAPLAYAISRNWYVTLSVLGISLCGAYVLPSRRPKGLHNERQLIQIEHMNSLLAAGADINAVDESHGHTALIIAIRNGDLSIVEALIAAGADVNCLTRASHSAPQTAMMIAVRQGDTEIIKALSNAGAA